MMDLITFLARMCHYAQDHVSDPDAWDHSRSSLEHLLQATSYQVACFLAQNTEDGASGVGWDVVINDLCQMPPHDEVSWAHIIGDIVTELGGLKKLEPNVWTIYGQQYSEDSWGRAGGWSEVQRVVAGPNWKATIKNYATMDRFKIAKIVPGFQVRESYPPLTSVELGTIIHEEMERENAQGLDRAVEYHERELKKLKEQAAHDEAAATQREQERG